MDQSGQLRRVFTQLEEPHLLHTLDSLDTVRALHQTVVALRKALESSQLEIQKLKKQINVNNEISDGKVYHSTDNLHQPQQEQQQQPSRQVTFSDHNYEATYTPDSEKKFHSKYDDAIPSTSSAPIQVPAKPLLRPSTASKEKKKRFTKTSSTQRNDNEQSLKPQISVTSYPKTQTIQNMASKIGVKIRVSSNIQMDSSSSEVDSARSSTTKDDNTSSPPDNKIETEKTSDLKICVTDVTQDETVIAPDDNDGITQMHDDALRGESTSSNLRLDVDSISMNSMSEGDNSVFTEGIITPVEHDEASALVQHSSKTTPSHDRSERESQSEHHEECDDIELIFSSDDKDIPQEDLVSISDYEPWQTGNSGTPVLVKYSPLPSDHLTYREGSSSDVQDIVSTRKKRGHAKFLERNCDESSEELSMERLNKSLDFTNKSLSFEKDSSPNDDSGADGAHEGADKFEVRFNPAIQYLTS